ncbi:MAG: hypothetical protein ACK5QX_08600 [bacterium]|jgi:hypothetical protein
MPRKLFDGSKPGPGRPKGSKNKLSEDFLRDMSEVWDAHGKAALLNVAQNEPAKFVQVAASLIPKEMRVETVRRAAELSDDELAAIIAGSSAGTADEAEGTGLTH